MTSVYTADRMASVNIKPEIISLIEEIRDDRTHGASQLARQAVKVLKVAAERSQADSVNEFLLELREVAQYLMSVRPAMASIFNIVGRFLGTMSRVSVEVGLDSIKSLAISKADELASESLQAIAQIANHGSRLITDGDSIMTHSYSSTVMAVLKEAFTRCRHIEVIVTRSGPGRTGERIAHELRFSGLPVTFIDDAAMGLYIPVANKVMVGADRVCADGNIINGIGTYLLALAAEKAGIPFYVLCETLKFDPRLRSGEVDLEEKEPSEIVEPRRLPTGVRVKNPSFDITPLELVTGIVTEEGLLTPEEVINYMGKPSAKDD